MLSWLGKQLISHNMRRISAGDPAPTLRLDADLALFPSRSLLIARQTETTSRGSGVAPNTRR